MIEQRGALVTFVQPGNLGWSGFERAPLCRTFEINWTNRVLQVLHLQSPHLAGIPLRALTAGSHLMVKMLPVHRVGEAIYDRNTGWWSDLGQPLGKLEQCLGPRQLKFVSKPVFNLWLNMFPSDLKLPREHEIDSTAVLAVHKGGLTSWFAIHGHESSFPQ